MSDFNDFPQNPNRNSYDSCLEAIDQCDHFILLIGGRVGGWYSEADHISITRMEYRHAYKRSLEGKLTLLAFVRQEVWDVREDRNQLKRYLSNEQGRDLELTPTEIEAIIAHPSKLVTDAATTFDFLKEVARIEEMKTGISTGLFPTGNWLYRFSTFREIVDAIRVCLGIRGSIRKATLTTALQVEISRNVGRILEKSKNGVLRRRFHLATPIREEIAKSKNHVKLLTRTEILPILRMLLDTVSVPEQLQTSELETAISSGEFYQYNVVTKQHVDMLR